MTSHYLRLVAKGGFEEVFSALQKRLGGIHSRRSVGGNGRKGLVLGEEYFLLDR